MVSEDNIFDTLKTFSFPRLSGTKLEKKAFNIALYKIKDLGVYPNTQAFQFSTFFSRVYPKIIFLLGTLTISLLFLFLYVPAIIIVAIINGSIILFLVFLMRNPENIRLYRYLESANLYVKLPSKISKIMNIFFICHLDSKGQKYIISIRIKAIRGFVFSLIIILGMIIIRSFLSGLVLLLFLIFGLIPIVINVICMIILLLNTTDNSSPGAVDNASGIACVFELLKHYTEEKNRFKNIVAWFVFTGAEETGTMGIRNFYDKIKHLEKDSVIIINFDSIGKMITIFDSWYKPNWYLDFYNKFVNHQKIHENPKRITLGSHSDGYFFKKKFYPGIEFGDLSSYEFMHSKDDTIDKIDPKLLKDLCEVIIDNLKEFDKLNAD
ncbi:MAG: M20/M25/M40 family metallo-hydrolase [Promethearchaeota archaeon]|nr:MAG: M20/M25/M40 family metallo-hydrolase [Candidatus Lokiarchaeota archaeon]